MSAEGDWTVRPRQGVGRLECGMSPAQVDALSDVYGAVSGRGNDRAADALLHETLEMFGGAMGPEEKDALLAAYAESGPPAEALTEARGDPGVILGYEADRLVQIMPAIGQRPLLLDGRDMFSLSAAEALMLLELRNGGPGRYADTEAAFDNLAISVDGFSLTQRDDGVRTLSETDARFGQRTVTVRRHPYLAEDAMDRFVTHRLA
ncbi:hypothetical protein FIV50_02605 [Microbacterium foliorum]|uniref:Uncharacterized protein n=2 Tax=Microbacterium foliorum TaxID=104336 RepID=A0A4Y5YVR3_9MICO|nr:hypothetical protein FIV50_02605 [Microbacterium foliorum]